MDQLSEPGFKYAESTLKKHLWVLPIYEKFSEHQQAEPWPIQAGPILAFLRWLGNDAGYSYGSIADVIVPSLKRINKDKIGGENLTKDVNENIQLALKELRRKIGNKCGQKQPAIYDDIAIIIKSTPLLETKEQESSLWLFAVYTGARSITCSNICIKDIIKVQLRDSGQILVQIMLRTTKGFPGNWNHVVTLEGQVIQNTDSDSQMDFVHWLNLHLQKNHNLSIEQYATWSLSEKQRETTLWKWKRSAMREIFSRRAISAGFPKGMLSFHSLRSGFLCSALINASSQKQIGAILENTAFVAGWVPGGKSQLGYLSTTTKKMIIANRLLTEEACIDKELGKSELFHNLDTLQPKWKGQESYQRFYNKLDNEISQMLEENVILSDCDQKQQRNLKDRVWNNLTNRFVSAKDQLEKKAQEVSTNPREILEVRKRIMKEWVSKQIDEDPQQIDNMIEEARQVALSYVKQYSYNIKNRIFTHTEKNKRKKIQGQEQEDREQQEAEQEQDEQNNNQRQLLTVGHRRVKKEWTIDETRILLQQKLQAKGWTEIAKYLPDRHGGDVKDRYRTILRQNKSLINTLKIYDVFQQFVDQETNLEGARKPIENQVKEVIDAQDSEADVLDPQAVEADVFDAQVFDVQINFEDSEQIKTYTDNNTFLNEQMKKLHQLQVQQSQILQSQQSIYKQIAQQFQRQQQQINQLQQELLQIKKQ